ncbi:MAG TPA: cell division protein SepF [Acidimicrobiia bacterium]|nr:cell division protein SepF [Acidimicrobiia bacterium]
MSSLFSKALVYLGLVDEDQIEAEAAELAGSPNQHSDPISQPRAVDALAEGRRVEPPPTARAATRPQARESVTRTDSSRRVEPPMTSPVVRPVEIQSDILVVEEFSDARVLADRVRDRVPVVLDMRLTDPDLVRRVVDFSSGLIYALDGSMRRVGDGLVLVLPPRVTLSRDEKRRLSTLGAYDLDDVDD